MNDLEHIKEFIEPLEGNRYFMRLLALPWKTVTWAQGRQLPRLVYRYDDDYIDVLEELKRLIEANFGVVIKGIWCNQYRNGKDWTPEHRDSYGEYVFTLSFGGTREFYFKNESTGAKQTFQLDHGDLIYFSSRINQTHKHAVPKSKSEFVRISVVFFT